MKTRVAVASCMTVSMMIIAVPVYSVEAVIDNHGNSVRKDECLLLAKNCETALYSIQERIEKLKEEIGKGNSAYTSEDLNVLKQKLRDQYRILNYRMKENQDLL